MQKLLQHQKNLKLFNQHRRGWLILSFFVVFVVLGIIFKWEKIHSSNIILWAVVSLGLTVSVVWWYWAMRLMRILIDYRSEESEILLDIYKTIGEIKQDVKNLPK